MAEKLRFYSSTADNLDAKAVETDSSVATPLNVKADYLFKDAVTRELLTGSMPVNPSVSIKLDPIYNGSLLTQYIVPKGYHDGTTRIYTGHLRDYTPGNATPEDVANNKVFWVNGERKVGTLNVEMANQEATATENDLVEGATAWVNKNKIVGTIPKLPRKDKILMAGESYTLPYGLSPGTSVVSAASLKEQTIATAKQSDIISGQTAWVNGEKVTGNLKISDKISEMMKETDTAKSQVLSGKKFYSSVYGQVVSGTMADHTGEATKTIPIGYQYSIPEGYYDGFSKITTQSLEDATQASAIASQILANKTAWVNGKKITGTMPYIDPVEKDLNAGTTYNIPQGYHTGNGTIVVKPLDKQTIGTATEENILDQKVAWVNGKKVIGSMPNNPDLNKSITPGETFYVPKGFHSGTGTVWVKPLKEFTPGDAISGNIINGKTAWVNGEKVTGSMPVVDSEEIVLDAGVKFTIPKGYHDGTGTVEAETLANQTVANAKADDIIKTKTAWVNGEKVTGSLELSGTAALGDVLAGSTFYNIDPKTKLTGTLALTGTASEEDVLEGSTFYNTNAKRKLVGSLKLTGTALAEHVLTGTSFYNTNAKVRIDGSMPNIGSVIVQLGSGSSYIIPKGYHDGTGIVKAPTLESVTEGTAEASDIYPGKTAWVNGEKITGTMALNGTVTPDKVVAGYTFYSTNPKQQLVGTMYTIPAQITKLFAGDEYTIPYGVHEGNGKVYAATLAEQTVGDALASNILNSKTAWVNGEKITGSMPNNGSVYKTLKCGESFIIPTGYHNGNGSIYSETLESQTIADAIAEQILIDKTAWVNGNKITGSMADNGAVEVSLNCGETYIVPIGFHNGNGSISANSLASQTVADAETGDLVESKTAWVNGVKITGTIPKSNLATVRINSGNDVTLPAGYYPDGITIYSLYTDRLDLTGTDAWYDSSDQSLHPESSGYVEGESMIVTAEIYE